MRKLVLRHVVRSCFPWALGLAWFIIGMVATANAQQRDSLKSKVQDLLDSRVDTKTTPGLAVSIFQEGRLRCNLVSGLRRVDEPKNPLASTDHFHLGSCTKAMTATLIGILVDEGTLDWSDTVADRLPQIRSDIDPRYQHVTLWQLLTHRGGIPRDGPGWNQGGVATLANRLAIVRQTLAKQSDPLKIGDYHYSNLGYVIVGLFAETAAGESYESLLTTRVWEPLGIKSGAFGIPDSNQPARQPWGHVKTGQGLNPVAMDNPPSVAAAGAAHMALSDWARFAALHLDSECQHHTLLRPATLARLHQPYSETNPRYAAGWLWQRNQAGQPRLSHSGSNVFWFASIRLCPDRDVALMTASNGPLSASRGTVEEIMDTVWDWLDEDPR